MGRLWARATIDTNNCAKVHNETGAFIGTAFVARDIVSVATALGEGDSIRYWGTKSDTKATQKDKMSRLT